MNVAYAYNVNRELNHSPALKRVKYFHYSLEVDDDGIIQGGSYYRDSSQIDILWVPLHTAPSGEEGNEDGNPHVSVDEVLSIYRDSVPRNVRDAWLNIDPLEEDIPQE